MTDSQMLNSHSYRDREILIISSNSGKGAVHVDKLFPSLVELGYKVTFLGWDRNNEYSKYYTEGGVNYRMIFSGWGFANKWLAIALPLWMIKAFWELCRLDISKYPIIMAIDFDSALPQALACGFNKIPFIYNIRDNFAIRTTLPRSLVPAVKWFDKFTLRQAKSVIVPDENRITAENDEVRKKFNVIHNGALEVSRPEGLSKDRPFTVYAMGYLEKVRGIELLLNVSLKMPNIRFLLAGNVYDAELLDRIRRGLNIEYKGWIQSKDALKLCYESDVIFAFYDPVSEINQKAASNKWFDAMMTGKPILVNEEVERSSWLMENDIGYSCPYGDVDVLTTTIRHIQSHPDEAKQKGKNGRRLYEQGYSWESSVEKIKKVIEESKIN
jgi:glycosyltransferase involved in cell wall biosynthesis